MILGIEAAHANKIQRTGVEEYCFAVIEELKKIIPLSERVILYSAEPLRGELGNLPPNWTVRILPWFLKKSWSQTRLAWELWRRPPEAYFAPGQLLPFWPPKNSAVMIHDCAFRAYPNAYRFWGRQYLKLMDDVIVRRARVILTSTEFNKKEIIRYYGVAPEKIKVIPLSYNSTRYHSGPSDPAVRKKFGLTKPYLMSVGRLEEKKNTKRIVEAFDLIKKQFDCQLLLVGKPGTGYEAVERAIAQSVNQQDIMRPGFLTNEELTALYQDARVFLFPSLYEGFGIPVLEAMACGTPVLAARGTALEEVGGTAALYADPHRAEDIAAQALKFLTDENLRREKIAAGLNHVKNFSWRRTAALTYEVLKNCQISGNLL